MATVTDEPRTAGPAFLTCVSGPDAGKRIALGDEYLFFGRATDCNLLSDDPRVIAHHATLQVADDALHVHALGGAPVVVDGQQVEDAALHPGARVCLGDSVWVVEGAPSGHAWTSAAAGPAAAGPGDASAFTPNETRWRRSETALAAGRGALLGMAAWTLVGSVFDEFGIDDLVGSPSRVWWWRLVLSYLLIYLAGSPRALRWVGARLRSRAPAHRHGAWAESRRLYAGWLSPRAAATLGAIVVVLLLHRPLRTYSVAAHGAGALLLAGLVTWSWLDAAERGRVRDAWKFGALAGAAGGAVWTALWLKLATADQLQDGAALALTVRNLLPGMLSWAVLGGAGGYALGQARTPRSPRWRLVVWLAVAAFVVQLVEVKTHLGFIPVAGDPGTFIASISAGVTGGSELVSLACMAVGWGLAATRVSEKLTRQRSDAVV